MDGYQLEADPFYVNASTYVSLFKGLSLTRNLPVVVKRHDFTLIQTKEVQVRMVQTLNAALAQAKVQHPNTCEILEVQMEINTTNCSIFHVLEALDTDLRKDIEDRRRPNRPYTERELRQMLQHTASALTYAHNKKIAHRDVKPSNIFRTAGTYKVGDFGCFFMNRDSSVTVSAAGDSNYMSPQLREACMRRSPYDAYKADVFALGASLLHMATLTSPKDSVTTKRIQEAVGRDVEALPYSAELKKLIIRMLAYEEGDRPTMKQVCDALVHPEEVKLPQAPTTEQSDNRAEGKLTQQPPKPAVQYQVRQSALLPPEEIKLPPTQPAARDRMAPESALQSNQLVLLTDYYISFFNFQTKTWEQQINLSTKIFAYSRWVLLEDRRVFCCGGTYTNEAYIIGGDGTVERQPDMNKARSYHGMLVVDAVYVFGGCKSYSGNNKSCEKLPLGTPQWRTLPPMNQTRAYFNPCLFGRLIYLFGVGSSTMEAFTPETDTFLPVNIRLSVESSSCCMYVHNELLVVHQKSYIMKFAVEGGQLVKRSEVKTLDVCKDQSSHPVVVSGHVYMVQWERCVRFKMETGEEDPIVVLV